MSKPDQHLVTVEVQVRVRARTHAEAVASAMHYLSRIPLYGRRLVKAKPHWDPEDLEDRALTDRQLKQRAAQDQRFKLRLLPGEYHVDDPRYELQIEIPDGFRLCPECGCVRQAARISPDERICEVCISRRNL